MIDVLSKDATAATSRAAVARRQRPRRVSLPLGSRHPEAHRASEPTVMHHRFSWRPAPAPRRSRSTPVSIAAAVGRAVRGQEPVSTSRACRRAPARRSISTGRRPGGGALVRKLEAAGAILVGRPQHGRVRLRLHRRNAHYGPSSNPHDITRMTGGSSGARRRRWRRRSAPGAGLRYQRLDPRAFLAVRLFGLNRPMDASAARAHFPCVDASIIWDAGALDPRISLCRSTPCRAGIRTIRPAPIVPPT